MNLLNLSEFFRKYYAVYFKKHPIYGSEPEGEINKFNFPYVIKKKADSALILGAGAGNDAAAALRNGVKKIDVVEIDPGIYKLGLQYHPEDPYSNPRVRVFIDDARSFIKKSNDKYDIIYYGLLDAHAQSSNMNNMRMDHYVYTEESFRDAKKLLKDDGIIIVNFWVQRIWIGQRIHKLVEKVFGWVPYPLSFGASVSGLGPIMVISGHDQNHIINLFKESSPKLQKYIMKNMLNYSALNDIAITTDDWPYLYSRKREIPSLYLCVMGILTALFFLSKQFLVPKGNRLNLHFFFLGAGFLLLEFQNINKTALLFGLTWVVNAINISAILIMILLANAVVALMNIKNLRVPYILLFISLVIIFFVPLTAYNFLDYWPKSLLAGFVLNLPIFFAGIIFMSALKRTPHKNIAMGSNLIGAAAGGLLESLSFLIGIRMLVLVTMGLYALSLIFFKKREGWF